MGWLASRRLWMAKRGEGTGEHSEGGSSASQGGARASGRSVQRDRAVLRLCGARRGSAPLGPGGGSASKAAAWPS